MPPVAKVNRFQENPVSLNDNISNKNASTYFTGSSLDDYREILNDIFIEYVTSHGIAINPSTDVQRIGSGVNGTVYRIANLDLAVSIMTDMLSNGLGVMFGFTKGSLQKVTIEYEPGASYESMLRMIKRAMTDYAVKAMWRSRKTQKGKGGADPMLAIKVQILDEADTVQDVRHENAVHAMLANNEDLSQLVPSMYAAATLGVPIQGQALKALHRVQAHAGKHITHTSKAGNVALRVTFMQFIAPTYKPLDYFLSKDAKMKTDKAAREKLYCKVRDAFLDLWAAGYAHGDSHANNVVVNTRTKSVCFFDFGFTVKLDDRVRQLCVSAKEAKQSGGDKHTLNTMFDTCEDAVNQNITAVLQRRYPWASFCNSDAVLVKSMRIWVDNPAEIVVAYKILARGVPQQLRPYKAAIDKVAAYKAQWFLDHENHGAPKKTIRKRITAKSVSPAKDKKSPKRQVKKKTPSKRGSGKSKTTST